MRWLLEAAGGKGLAAIAYALNNRAAKAECCVALLGRQRRARSSAACAEGEILVEPRGEQHFGWDAWFQPRGSKKTFAEMTDEEKDKSLASRRRLPEARRTSQGANG